MVIEKNSRQMPSNSMIKEKDYCDLLYAWIQCNSERVALNDSLRRIAKNEVKWVKIEKDFTRIGIDGEEVKAMERRTIAKYFKFLLVKGLVYDMGDEFYYIEVLPANEATLIEYETLMKMMNTLQRHVIDLYIYLFNRYYANGCQPFIGTMKQIKSYLGMATSTTSNNMLISDGIEILERLGLLTSKKVFEDGKTRIYFMRVANRLP